MHCNTLQLYAGTKMRRGADNRFRPQPTATHCNTLQLTTAHCNSLQLTATHCNALQLTATHCNSLVQHTATYCNALQHTATHCNTLQHTATHCNTLQHTFIQSHTQVDMHRIFQRDLCKLRLNAARAYVKGRTVYCSVLQYVVVCCSDLRCVALCLNAARAFVKDRNCRGLVLCVAVCF